MEFVTIKRKRSQKRKAHLKKRRRNKAKFEVRTSKRQRVLSERTNIYIAKEILGADTMQASSFWQNYTAAQEWQRRHSVTWWRTRCYALEYENRLLRDKLKSLAYDKNEQSFVQVQETKQYQNQNGDEQQEETALSEENENLEFHINEDMMTFLEQSIKHKIELKKKRESESRSQEQEDRDSTYIQGGAAWMQARNNSAKLLYGEASPAILAMETALQTTVDRHKDKAKPQYWPIIPIKT